MKSQERADLLAAMMELCEQYPHWRFGQLVSNVAGWADHEIWDVEDEQLLAAARLHLAQLAPRESGFGPTQGLKPTGAAIRVSGER